MENTVEYQDYWIDRPARRKERVMVKAERKRARRATRNLKNKANEGFNALASQRS